MPSMRLDASVLWILATSSRAVSTSGSASMKSSWRPRHSWRRVIRATTSGVRSSLGRFMKSNSCIARMVYRAKIVFFCLKNEFSASKQRKMMQKAIEMR